MIVCLSAFALLVQSVHNLGRLDPTKKSFSQVRQQLEGQGWRFEEGFHSTRDPVPVTKIFDGSRWSELPANACLIFSWEVVLDMVKINKGEVREIVFSYCFLEKSEEILFSLRDGKEFSLTEVSRTPVKPSNESDRRTTRLTCAKDPKRDTLVLVLQRRIDLMHGHRIAQTYYDGAKSFVIFKK